MSNRRREEAEWVMQEQEIHRAKLKQQQASDLRDLIQGKFLKTEFLYRNGPMDCDAASFSKALQDNETISSLVLSNISIHSTWLVEVILALEANHRITSLSLHGFHEMGDAMVTQITTLIKNGRSFTSLELSAMGVTVLGAAELASVLKNNTQLKHVNLKWNRLGEQGGQALWRALNVNVTLMTMALYSNGISKRTMDAIQNLVSNRNTRDFDLFEAERREPLAKCSLEKMRRGLTYCSVAEEHERVKGILDRLKKHPQVLLHGDHKSHNNKVENVVSF